MRKIAYIYYLLMVIRMDIVAQINGDYSWESQPFFYDDFSGTRRGWGSNFIETQQGNFNFTPHWRCYYEQWDSGVTLDNNQHHIFQRSQCQFNAAESTLNILAEFVDENPIQCGSYEMPCPSWHCNNCDPLHQWLYYYSGCLETLEDFRYGYFEIRCKMPVHQGAFPAFWLWGKENGRYEEIDMFEYMWNITKPSYNPQSPFLGYPFVYDTGIWYRGEQEADRTRYASEKVYLSTNGDDLTGWHVYGCEWSPGVVVWYCDGEIVNEFHDSEHVPHGYMNLITNYSINNWALKFHNFYNSDPDWRESDSLVVDYIKVVKLKPADCNTDLGITSLPQFLNYDYRQKHSITIGDGLHDLVVPANVRSTMRASESIVFNAGFEAQVGAELTFMVHGCPE